MCTAPRISSLLTTWTFAPGNDASRNRQRYCLRGRCRWNCVYAPAAQFTECCIDLYAQLNIDGFDHLSPWRQPLSHSISGVGRAVLDLCGGWEKLVAVCCGGPVVSRSGCCRLINRCPGAVYASRTPPAGTHTWQAITPLLFLTTALLCGTLPVADSTYGKRRDLNRGAKIYT